MSEFDFAFTLYSLLLGLALAEVLSGLGQAVKARKRVRIGYLTPLLATFVMVDLSSFWTTAWSFRDHVSVNYLTMMAMLAFIGAYYLAASLVFPDLPEGRTSLDEHYWANKRLVVGTIAILNRMSYSIDRVLTVSPFLLTTRGQITVGLFFAMLIGVILSRDARTNGILLIAITVSYAASSVWGLLD